MAKDHPNFIRGYRCYSKEHANELNQAMNTFDEVMEMINQKYKPVRGFKSNQLQDRRVLDLDVKAILKEVASKAAKDAAQATLEGKL